MTQAQNEDEEDEKSCPGCGALQSEWAGYDHKGFISNRGDLYCCQACAEGRACNCNPAQ